MSKWDVHSSVMGPGQPRSSLEAAAEAAAKVNAMLIAKGKLKPSQLSNATTNKQKNTLVVAEVDINDAPISCRNLLTRGSTQDEISKMSGAAVSTRGRFISPEDRAKNLGERALYLCVQASTKPSVDKAVNRIQEIIQSHCKTKPDVLTSGVVTVSKFSPTPPISHMNAPIMADITSRPPPPLMSLNTQPSGMVFVQDKLFIGLEHAPPSFDVKGKVTGLAGSFLNHIQLETGAKVTLRGKGSGFLEPASGREAFEAMHIHIQHANTVGLQQAKQLSENLIQTVQQEYAQFQQALASMPPAVNQATASLLASISPLQQPGSVAVVAQPGVASSMPQPPVNIASYPGQLQTSMPPPGMVQSSSAMTLTRPPAPLVQQPPPTASLSPPGVVHLQAQSPAVVTVPPQQSSVTSSLLQPPPGPALTDPQLQALPIQQPLEPQVAAEQLQVVGQQQLAAQQLAAQPQMHMVQPPPQILVSHPVPTSIFQPQVTMAQMPAPVAAFSQPPPQIVQPAASFNLPLSQPQPAVPQQAVASSQLYYNQYVVPHSTVVSTSTASSTYSRLSRTEAPRKRRFKEEKNEEKVPDNLLGYQHGPPHLTNLQQDPEYPNGRSDVGTPAQSDMPPPGRQMPAKSLPILDKQLMPPPPPPVAGQDLDGGVDRKRLKGALGSLSTDGIPPSTTGDDNEASKFSHYAGKPQHYPAASPKPSENTVATYQLASQAYHPGISTIQPGYDVTSGNRVDGAVVFSQPPPVSQYYPPPASSYTTAPPTQSPPAITTMSSLLPPPPPPPPEEATRTFNLPHLGLPPPPPPAINNTYRRPAINLAQPPPPPPPPTHYAGSFW